MQSAIVSRALLIIPLAAVCFTGAKGAEPETLDLRSAPSVLEPLEFIPQPVGQEEIQIAPNGQVIRTIVLEGWEGEDEVEPLEHFNERMETLPASCTSPIANDDETYAGQDREVAKTQVVDAPLDERNLTVKGLYQLLLSDDEMRAKDIKRRCDSQRVRDEEKNVTVTAYLIAAAKERDNDFHLILQDRGCTDPNCRLSVEVVGLPRRDNSSSGVLRAARQFFKEQWPLYSKQHDIPTVGSFDFVINPLLVRVTGSVFYDVDHGAGHSGPQGYKPGSAWEIHPATSFEFDPKTEHSLFALISRNSAFDRQSFAPPASVRRDCQ